MNRQMWAVWTHAVLLAVVVLAGSGCSKRLTASVGDVDLEGGRPLALKFGDGSEIHGALVPGGTVRYARNDSLFAAEVDEVTDDSIVLSRHWLLTGYEDWSALFDAQEHSGAVAGRADLGARTLELDGIDTLELVLADKRRMVTEVVFWTAAALTLGFAGAGR